MVLKKCNSVGFPYLVSFEINYKYGFSSIYRINSKDIKFEIRTLIYENKHLKHIINSFVTSSCVTAIYKDSEWVFESKIKVNVFKV